MLILYYKYILRNGGSTTLDIMEDINNKLEKKSIWQSLLSTFSAIKVLFANSEDTSIKLTKEEEKELEKLNKENQNIHAMEKNLIDEDENKNKDSKEKNDKLKSKKEFDEELKVNFNTKDLRFTKSNKSKDENSEKQIQISSNVLTSYIYKLYCNKKIQKKLMRGGSMIVMDNDGNIFEERRKNIEKNDHKNARKKSSLLKRKNKDDWDGTERRKKDINL